MTESINFSEVWKWIKKYQVVFLLLIPVFLCIFLRVQTYYLPGADDMAQQQIVSNIKSNIEANLRVQYPMLPQDAMTAEVNKQYSEFIKTNNIKPYVQQQSQAIKNYYQDADGRTYLLELDPYHWYQLANNFVNHGFMGEEMIDGQSVNTKMRGRSKEVAANFNFHSFFEAIIYWIINFFNRSFTLMQACFITPVIMMTLATIAWFFVGRNLFGNVGGLITATIITCHSSLMARTVAGFSDTDSYYMLWPGVAILCFLHGINKDKVWQQVLWFSIAGLAIAILHFSWGGFWYILLFLLFASLCMVPKSWKLSLTAILTLLITTTLLSGLLGLLLMSPQDGKMMMLDNIQSLYELPLSFINLKSVGEFNVWPNVMTTVAELNPSSIEGVVGNTGSTLYILAICGLTLAALMLSRNWKNKTPKELFILALMLIWIAASTYASIKSIRFVALMIPGIALAMAYLMTRCHAFITKKWNIPVYANIIFSIFILIIILVPIITAAYNTTKQEFPLMNDEWYNSLTALSKDHGSNNSIVLTYWDEGHFIKVLGNTSVFFDGGDQGKRIYWSGRFMLSNDPEESRAIMKMIDCNVDVLNDRYDSQIILDEKDCKPYEEYLLLSEDLIGKAGVWAHFGSWNFTRANMYKDTYKLNYGEGTALLQEKYNLSQDEATNTYVDIQSTTGDMYISPWHSYVGGWRSCNNQTLCELGYNLGQQNGQNIILNSVMLENETWKFTINNQVTINETDFNFGVIHDKKNNRVMIADKKLVNSLFTRLYLLDETIPGYEKLESASNNVVKIWRVKQ